MKNVILLILFISLFYNCETTHSRRKLIRNNSTHSFHLKYNNYMHTDSIFFIYPGDYVYIINYQNLGNHPEQVAYPPCSMISEDTIDIIISNFTFIGDFKDEYRWEESISGNRHTIHECAFTVIDNDFQ